MKGDEKLMDELKARNQELLEKNKQLLEKNKQLEEENKNLKFRIHCMTQEINYYQSLASDKIWR